MGTPVRENTLSISGRFAASPEVFLFKAISPFVKRTFDVVVRFLAAFQFPVGVALKCFVILISFT